MYKNGSANVIFQNLINHISSFKVLLSLMVNMEYLVIGTIVIK